MEPSETPPRAWGRPCHGAGSVSALGNTPTSVGKTQPGWASHAGAWKHPHERGEDRGLLGEHLLYAETPPRAWGRPPRSKRTRPCNRNTPTSVGKTPSTSRRGVVSWKHPHERGEDLTGVTEIVRQAETPPRAWGRPMNLHAIVRHARNTPTSVGKTPHHRDHGDGPGKHPHERGEDDNLCHAVHYVPETPPRAWGRRAPRHRAAICSRNTPTSVGKTYLQSERVLLAQKHPHERGEDRAATGGR